VGTYTQTGKSIVKRFGFNCSNNRPELICSKRNQSKEVNPFLIEKVDLDGSLQTTNPVEGRR
jgi:hypothetical protein